MIGDPSEAARVVAGGEPVVLVGKDASAVGATVSSAVDNAGRERLLAVMVGDPEDPGGHGGGQGDGERTLSVDDEGDAGAGRAGAGAWSGSRRRAWSRRREPEPEREPSLKPDATESGS